MFAAFFARLLKRAGLIKTRTCDLVTLGVHFSRIAQMAKREQTVLVLQGGGALGAYQAGVYEGIAETGLDPNWIAGVSIGAINAALIAGNLPERRVERLREFWDRVSSTMPLEAPAQLDPLRVTLNPQHQTTPRRFPAMNDRDRNRYEAPIVAQGCPGRALTGDRLQLAARPPRARPPQLEPHALRQRRGEPPNLRFDLPEVDQPGCRPQLRLTR